METSLLTTKLNIPPARPQLVTRQRLIERLDEGLGYNLILVSAPAGFGKTTLLSDWVRRNQSKIPTVWLSLDAGDNDPVRFWDYSIAALQTLQPSCGENILPLLHSSQPPSTEPMLTTLINDLSSIMGDFVVVLDDYHFIESQQIHDGITYLLEHMPVQMHLVIASRADPPLPLAHFRGRGIMVEIRTDNLRFTLDDTISLLTELKTPELSSEDVTVLNERTEGWAVGLKMAALSMKEQKDIPGFIDVFTGSQRYVMDYLMEEVLQKQTQEVRDFLLKTSVLERLSGPLCDVVTGRKGSQDILLNLDRGHLFIVPLDELRQWYRYEHLFSDLLRHQLETTFDKENINELHRRVSEWYENNNFPDEAIHHILAAQEWDEAVRLIIKHGRNTVHSGEFTTLINWIKSFPIDILEAHSQLSLYYCRALVVIGQFDAAESELKKLNQAAQDDESILGEVAALQFHLAQRRGDTNLKELGLKALSLLPSEKSDVRSYICYILGAIYCHEGNARKAESLLFEAYNLALHSKNYYHALAAVLHSAFIIFYAGKLRQAREMLQDAIERVGDLTIPVFPYMGLSVIEYEKNELEVAEQYIQKAIKLQKLVGTVDIQALIHNILAKIKFARGDIIGARKALEEADFVASRINIAPGNRAHDIAYRMDIEIRNEDLAAASEWYDKLKKYADSMFYYDRGILARFLIAQQKKEAAAEILRITFEQSIQGNGIVDRVKWRVYQALAAETEAAALDFLTEALTMAEPEGYIRTFVDEGKLLAPLLEKVISRGIKPEYAGELLTIIQAEERRKLGKRETTHSTTQGILSEREMEILQLLVEGLSNRQIADRLFISQGTTKVHVHNIFEKLNVKSRPQVIARARQLKII